MGPQNCGLCRNVVVIRRLSYLIKIEICSWKLGSLYTGDRYLEVAVCSGLTVHWKILSKILKNCPKLFSQNIKLFARSHSKWHYSINFFNEVCYKLMATKPPKHFCYLGSLFEIFRFWLAFDLWRLLNVWNYWPDPTRTYPTCLLKIIAKWPYVSLKQANLLIIASVFCRFSFDLRRNVTKLPDLRFSWTL